jgi:homoserine O-acetyltransferase/O-succinyltransferase
MTEFIPPATQFVDLPSPFPMKRGGELHQSRMAFETWGTLNSDKSNAILILTGLSPNAHAASSAANPDQGWWEAMLGPGKAIDTNHWFVICVNTLGSCKGSTGPASLHPDGHPYRLRFPDLSIEDCANSSVVVVRSLGITQLNCVIGNSMGGMTALALMHLHKGIARRHINISGSAQALPFSIAIRSLQREAIRLDPLWANGDYSDSNYPESGMRIARKLGVVTYRSAIEWDGRFGRVRFDNECAPDDPFGQEFEVERYLEGHARRFVHQFDPNSYLYLSRSMDWFDLSEYAGGDIMKALANISVHSALAIGVQTDILFPLQQQQQIADGLALGGCDAHCLALPSPQGHDAFLVDIERFGPAVKNFLERT